MESVCTILRRFFALELRGTAEASHFRSNLLLRMEFFEGEERSTFDINEYKARELNTPKPYQSLKESKTSWFLESSRVVCKLILRVLGFTSFSRSLTRRRCFSKQIISTRAPWPLSNNSRVRFAERNLFSNYHLNCYVYPSHRLPPRRPRKLTISDCSLLDREAVNKKISSTPRSRLDHFL